MALEGFVCRRCGACCRIPDGIVRLTNADITRIAAYLETDELTFIRDETVLSPDRACLILKDRADGACGMLDGAGFCRIHAVKPEQCRTFPTAWRNPGDETYCEGLRAIINSGNLV